MGDFRHWLIETILRTFKMSETVFSFGKYRGKDHRDPAVDTGWLQWAVANVGSNMIPPQFRQEIEAEINRRQTSPARPSTPRQPVRPVDAEQTPAERVWVKAQAISSDFGLTAGQNVAMSKQADGGWGFITLDQTKKTGVIPATHDVAQVVKSLKGADGQPLKTTNPQQWMPPPAAKSKGGMLPDEHMPPGSEQRAIDDKFAKILEGGEQSHIVISALAGSGKTTMLQHLAWKYGKPSQKWLYLVFNTKNRVEGKQRFPGFVDVQTTNSFLGHLLGHAKNVTRLPQTELMAKLKAKDDDASDGKPLEKSRIMVDSPEFEGLMAQAGVPNSTAARGVGDDEYQQRALDGLLNSMQYSFKESVVTLLGLAKSFAIDPRKPDSVRQGIDNIVDKYDLDTDMTSVKERIQKYKPSFSVPIKRHLRNILGYDLMEKDFTEDIKKATVWLLEQTMPQATNMTYQMGRDQYELGQFRDFSDDLWYAAVHADELHWPHYDVVLADEVQDFNEAQKVVLGKLAAAGAKVVAVGDENQSIYRFRGADSDAFSNMNSMLTGLSKNKDVTQTLTKNYRSRPAIIDFINRRTHVKNLKAGKTFSDGNPGVVTDHELKYNDAFSTLKKEKDAGAIKETAFIARTNEPLVHAALRLLGQGIPFVIVGRDVAKDLLRHIGRVVKSTRLNDNTPVFRLAEQLDGHLNDEVKKFGTHSTKKHYLKGLDETTLALTSAIGQFSPNPGDGKTIGQFRAWLKAKLSGFDVQESEQDLEAFRKKMEQEKPVVLTTGHKSKGLEFERVYILRDDQFPHPKAERPADIAQEENNRYISLSRAVDELHVLKVPGQPGTKEEGQEQ